MALAALGITATENADAFWLSNNLHPANHRPSKYHGLKIYASCPPDAKPDHPPYAIILKINPQASLVDGVEFLGNVIDGVMKDFFFKYATGFEEVSWVYRDLNGFLYIIKTDHEGRIVRAKKIASNWDGSNFLDIGIDFQVDNRLQLMIQEAISHI